MVFKMCDSVLSARYSSVCNVLRQWRIWFIPTYRVYTSMIQATRKNIELRYYFFPNIVSTELVNIGMIPRRPIIHFFFNTSSLAATSCKSLYIKERPKCKHFILGQVFNLSKREDKKIVLLVYNFVSLHAQEDTWYKE